MHTNSLPPSDRPEVDTAPSTAARRSNGTVNPAISDDLVKLLTEYRDTHDLTNAELGRQLAYSAASISQYLNKVYPGDITQFERRIADLLSNASRRIERGSRVVESEVTRRVCATLELIRKTNDVGILSGEAGEGKSSGLELYSMKNPLSIVITATAWASGPHDIERLIWEQVSHRGWSGTTSRGAFLAHSLRGSNRLLIIDNAHKLSRKALQWVFDFHDATKCGVVLVGNPEIIEKIEDSDQRFSRVGLNIELKVKDRTPLVRHLVSTIVADAPEELFPLAMKVAEERGHFRALEKQLQLSAELKNGNSRLTWTDAFQAAHTKLVRKYNLN